MKNVLLKATDLCKSFANNGTQNHVLDNINLEIYEGDFTVIMGPSGSGKSTLLYCLSGMDRMTSGKVIYKNEDISNLKEKEISRLRSKEFGFVFQQMHLVSNLSLYENATVAAYLDHDKKSSDICAKADELFKLVNIENAKDRLPSQVSGGEAQRAAIVRAIISEPGLVYADEPTGALNKKNTYDILHIMTKLNNNGQSILMVTHDIRAAVRASRLLYLEDGKIIGDMNLPPYKTEDSKEREAQINAWLASMEW